MTVNQWDAEYSDGDYTERLDTITHVAHHAVILGYLSYGAKKPKVLDIGCGHGRLLQLLAGLGFAEYVGVDWSTEGIERARSLLIPSTRFEAADMNHWDTTELFDAIVLNNCLSYADDPSQMFERTLEWLAEDGLVIVAMYRGLGARYIWSRIDSAPVELVAACAVRDYGTGAVWDVKALRPRSAKRAMAGSSRRTESPRATWLRAPDHKLDRPSGRTFCRPSWRRPGRKYGHGEPASEGGSTATRFQDRPLRPGHKILTDHKTHRTKFCVAQN